jgi:hypothetical protein
MATKGMSASAMYGAMVFLVPFKEMFEDAKTLGPGDRVPGSLAWCQERGGGPS